MVIDTMTNKQRKKYSQVCDVCACLFDVLTFPLQIILIVLADSSSD